MPLPNLVRSGGQSPMSASQWSNPDAPALQPDEIDSAKHLALLKYDAILDKAGHCIHARRCRADFYGPQYFLPGGRNA
jgi:hypothetical protein